MQRFWSLSLRQAVAEELADTAHRYVEDPLRPSDLKGRTNEATDEKQVALHDSVASCPEKGLTGKQ